MRVAPFAAAAILLVCRAAPALAQPDPADLGAPDSLYIDLSSPALGFDDSTLTADLYVVNDAQDIVGLTVGLSWNNNNLALDSARVAPGAAMLSGLLEILYYRNDLDSSNAHRRCQCVLMSIPGNELPPSEDPHKVATYYFTLSGWAPGEEICFDATPLNSISLVDPEAGEYNVAWGGEVCRQAGEDLDGDGRGDQWDNCPALYNPDQADLDDDGLGDPCDADDDGDLVADEEDNCPTVYNPGQEDSDGDGVGDLCESSCCSGRVGDANGEGGDEPTIGDISVIIDMLFISEQPVNCLAEADVNQSGGLSPTAGDITIGDISILIDYLFISGPDPGLNDCL